MRAADRKKLTLDVLANMPAKAARRALQKKRWYSAGEYISRSGLG